MQPLPTQPRILCLWLPNWPIQRLIVAQPELRKRRVVLFRHDSRRGRLVAAASPLAGQHGVQVGMPLSEAKSLLRRSGHRTAKRDPMQFHILAHDPAADLYAIEKLADDLDNFSPIVGLQQDTDHPDCILLDVTGLAELFDGETNLATGVFQHLKKQGYLAYIAIANTIGQAEGAAKFYCRSTPAGSPNTNQANAPTSPQAEICLPAASAYRSLPVQSLRVSDWICTTLNQLGIGTIEQLLLLPRKDLLARFGKTLHRRLDQMTGEVAEPIVAQKKPAEYQAEQLLEYPTSHLETVEVIMQRLIEDICQQMSAAQHGALQWQIRLYCQDRKLPLKLNVSLFQPTTQAAHVVQLVGMQLEQLLQWGEPDDANQPPQPQPSPSTVNPRKRSYRRFAIPFQVTEISIAVSSCVVIAQRQRNLFDENPRLDKPALAHLINRLSGRLGRENVVYPALVSGAQPEYAFQMKPLVNPYSRGPRRGANKKATHTMSHVMGRPLKLFQPAIELQSADTNPNGRHSDQPPSRLLFFGHQHRVVHSWGPERIETGWWRGPTVRRDYWRIETQTHQQFWIYKDLRRQSWFLQGEF